MKDIINSDSLLNALSKKEEFTKSITEDGSTQFKLLSDFGHGKIEQIKFSNDLRVINFDLKLKEDLIIEIPTSSTNTLYFAYTLNGVSYHSYANSERYSKINELKSVTPAKLQMLKGFGESKSETICKGLAEQYKTLNFLLNRNFNLKHTQSEISGEGLSGLSIVFTGSMTGSRADMKIDAKAKGAKVQSTVNSKTSYLCCGSNVGKTKIDTANELGVKIISEEDYWKLC